MNVIPVPTPSQFSFALPLTTAYDVEGFAVSAANTRAFDAIARWPQWEQPVLVLHGPPASGKTHLAHIWALRSGARFVAASALTREAVQSIVTAGEAAQPWLVEDIGRLAEEAALFHLMNAIREQGGFLLLTAGAAPAQMEIALADLRSRLCAAPVAELHAPDEAALAAVIAKQFADRQLRVPDEVVQYLVLRMDRSFAAASRWVARIDEAALAAQRKVTVALVRQLLEEDAESREPPLL